MSETLRTDPTLQGRVFVVSPEAYKLPPERLNELESDLISELNAAGVTTGVVTVLAKPETAIADLGRTIEDKIFREKVGEDYDFHAGMAPYESRSRFMFTVDLDASTIPHAKRLVVANTEEERAATGLTGIEIFDDRIKESGEESDLKAILAYHGIEGPEQCMNVTTNEVTERGPAPTLERPYTLISYKAVFEIGKILGKSFVTAYLNNGAIKSLGKAGVVYQLLGGQEFHLPIPPDTDTETGESKRYDEKYVAVVIPADEHNAKAFTEVNPENRWSKLIAPLRIVIFDKESNQTPLVQIQ